MSRRLPLPAAVQAAVDLADSLEATGRVEASQARQQAISRCWTAWESAAPVAAAARAARVAERQAEEADRAAGGVFSRAMDQYDWADYATSAQERANETAAAAWERVRAAKARAVAVASVRMDNPDADGARDADLALAERAYSDALSTAVGHADAAFKAARASAVGRDAPAWSRAARQRRRERV